MADENYIGNNGDKIMNPPFKKPRDIHDLYMKYIEEENMFAE